MLIREREVEEDIESGMVTGGEDGASGLLSTNNQTRNFSDGVRNGISSFYRLVNSTRFDEVADGCMDSLTDKNSEGEGVQNHMASLEERHVEDRQMRKASRKPTKPPRPPKGPLLDAADQKLVQEITELAIRRRARIERIKALKKMRAAKSSSWNSSLPAIIITTLFFLIIFFQGISSKSGGSILSQGSPAPAVAASEGFISVQLSKNFSASKGYGPRSGYATSASEQASVSGLRKR